MRARILISLAALALAASGCGTSSNNPSSTEEPVGSRIPSNVTTTAAKSAEKSAGANTADTSTSSKGHYVNIPHTDTSTDLKDAIDNAVKTCRQSAKQVQDRAARAQILKTCDSIK